MKKKCKTCNNCFWEDQCADKGKRCEYYDPIIGSENIIAKEYEESLKERVACYDEIVEEFDD